MSQVSQSIRLTFQHQDFFTETGVPCLNLLSLRLIGFLQQIHNTPQPPYIVHTPPRRKAVNLL